jgi:tetratricopeptide (TPR) repeat protein
MVVCRLALAALLLTWSVTSVTAQPASPEPLDKGFQALQSGDAARADAIFREALTGHPRDPQLLFGAGMAASLQGRDQEAISLLKQALQIEPRLLQAAALLGELLYRQGDLDLAIKMYERALPGAPPSVAVAMRGRLSAWREEASLPQNHEAIKDDRFTISFDGPVQQTLAARAVSVLNASFWRIGKVLGAYPSAPTTSFCTAKNSSTTSPARRSGPAAASTARFESRFAARRRISLNSIACSLTS